MEAWIPYQLSQFASDTGSHVPLRLYITRTEAETECVERLRCAHRMVNPFIIYESLSGEYDYDEDEDVDELAERLKFIGLSEQPPLDRYALKDWPTWWDNYQDRINDEQRAAVYQLFNQRPLFEVVEIAPVGGVTIMKLHIVML